MIFCGVLICSYLMVFVVFPYKNETHKVTSQGASPVKTWQKTVFIGEKLCVINQLEKGENIANIYCAGDLNKSTIFTVFNSAEKIKMLSQYLSCVP
jgi:hypothetical protein